MWAILDVLGVGREASGASNNAKPEAVAALKRSHTITATADARALSLVDTITWADFAKPVPRVGMATIVPKYGGAAVATCPGPIPVTIT